MRGIHSLLATLLIVTTIPVADAATLDVTVPLSKLCWHAPPQSPSFDRLDPVLPASLERVTDHYEDLEFWCTNAFEDIEL